MNNDYNDYLMHYGIKGQKWGERRYQNEDGTLTPEGIERYRKSAKGRINAAADLALTALSVRNTAVGIDASIRKGMQNAGKIETISGLPKDYKKKD